MSYSGRRARLVRLLPVARWIKPNVKERVCYQLPDGTVVCSYETFEYIERTPGLMIRDGVVVPRDG